MQFDPNAASEPDSGIFGLPFGPEEARIHLLPVPWEATVSYGGGTCRGPEAIFDASLQVDLFDPEIHRPYEPGIYFHPIDERIPEIAERARRLALPIIEMGGFAALKAGTASSDDPKLGSALAEVNRLGEELNAIVEERAQEILGQGRIPGVIGGDHSVPFGAIRAAAKRGTLGILHFDAHSDTRDAYEGFTWSHASVFRNVMDRVPNVEKIVQVGIRDWCEEERDYAQSLGPRARVVTDLEISRWRFDAKPFSKLADSVVAELPRNVWVSFDVDGLDPRLCPHTGTPVPGGLDFNEACLILSKLARSGRKIVGFDLCEVAPAEDPTDEWDANVGARLVYRLCANALASQGHARFHEEP